MGKLRFAAFVTIVLGALVLAAPALAGYAPRLIVTNQGNNVGSAGVNIKFTQPANDDPTARVVILVPKGYSMTTSGAAGSRIGGITTTVIASDVKRTVRTSGALVVANPSEFAGQAEGCIGGAKPAAVWSFTVAVGGQSLRVPIFVETKLAGPADQFGVASLTMCFAAGDTKPGTPGRAVLGSKIVNFVLSTKAISSPKTNGIYRWRSSTTPYTAGTGSQNLKGIVEVQSVVPLPIALSLSAKVGDSTRAGYSQVTLSGDLKAMGQGQPGIFLVIKRGSAPKGLKQLGVLSTNRTGRFGTKGEVRRTSRAQRFYFQVTTGLIEKDLGEAGCQATVQNVRCIDATLPYNISSRTVAVTIPPR